MLVSGSGIAFYFRKSAVGEPYQIGEQGHAEGRPAHVGQHLAPVQCVRVYEAVGIGASRIADIARKLRPDNDVGEVCERDEQPRCRLPPAQETLGTEEQPVEDDHNGHNVVADDVGRRVESGRAAHAETLGTQQKVVNQERDRDAEHHRSLPPWSPDLCPSASRQPFDVVRQDDEEPDETDGIAEQGIVIEREPSARPRMKIKPVTTYNYENDLERNGEPIVCVAHDRSFLKITLPDRSAKIAPLVHGACPDFPAARIVVFAKNSYF